MGVREDEGNNKGLWHGQCALLAAGHALLHAQPGGGRALSAIQCLGLDLCQSGHRYGTVASHAAAEAGLLVLAGRAMARWIAAAAAHGIPQF
ncbi:hypothetical protein D3C78_1433470 [compost metagenome]